MWRRFGEVYIAVDDLASALSHFAALSGHEPVLGHEARFALSNANVDLCAPTSGSPLPAAELGIGAHAAAMRERLEKHGPGVFGFSLECDDLERCALELSRRGIDSLVDPIASPGAGLRVLDPTRTAGLHICIRDSSDRGSDARAETGAASAAAEGRVVGIDHIVIRTRAPERAIRLLRDGLGIRLALDRTFPARRVRLIFFRVGGVTLELAVPAASLGAEGSAEDTSRPDFLWGVAYQVAEPRRAHARLRESRFDLSPVRAGNKSGTEVFTVRGEPLGVPTLVIGPQLPSGACASDEPS